MAQTFRSLTVEMLDRRVKIKEKNGTAKWTTMREIIVTAQTNRATSKCDPETIDLLAQLSELVDGENRVPTCVTKIRPDSIGKHPDLTIARTATPNTPIEGPAEDWRPGPDA